MSGCTKRQCDRALVPPRAASAVLRPPAAPGRGPRAALRPAFYRAPRWITVDRSAECHRRSRKAVPARAASGRAPVTHTKFTRLLRTCMYSLLNSAQSLWEMGCTAAEASRVAFSARPSRCSRSSREAWRTGTARHSTLPLAVPSGILHMNEHGVRGMAVRPSSTV